MLIDKWTCANCNDTQPGGTAPCFVDDVAAPIPGTRAGVCTKCKRELRLAKKAAAKEAASAPSGVQPVTLGADVPSPLVTDEMPEREERLRAQDSPPAPEVALVPIGNCERCTGPILGDPERKRKKVPRWCSDRCRVAAYHAAKRSAA